MRRGSLALAAFLAIAACSSSAFSWPPGGVQVGHIEPEPIGGGYPPYQVPGLAADGRGGAFVVWPTLGGSDPYPTIALKMVRVTASGALDPQWPAGGLSLRSPAGSLQDAHVVSDGAGGAFVAWSQQVGGSPVALGVQHVTSTGAVAPGWPADGYEIPNVAHYDAAVLLADGSGGFYVVWAAKIPFPSTDVEIRAQRFASDGSSASGWPANGVLLHAQAWQSTPGATVSDGQLFVAWTRQSASLDLAVQCLTPSGVVAPGWPTNGITINPIGDQIRPACVADGSHGAYLTWRDSRSQPDQVYLQRLTATGDPAAGWPAYGRPAGDAATGAGVSPTLALDASGGAFVAWVRPLGLLWSQHVQSDGSIAPSWPTAGLNTGLGGEWAENVVQHAVLADLVGGVFVVGRSAGLVVERFHPGTTIPPGWPVALGTVAVESGPAMVSDGVGGCIVAWYDSRNGGVDVYADRLTADGTAPTDIGPAAEAGGLVAWPIPSSGEIRFLLRSDSPLPSSIDVFDVTGRLVRRVATRGVLGSQVLTWDRRDSAGRPVGSGTYFARVRGAHPAAPVKIVVTTRSE